MSERTLKTIPLASIDADAAGVRPNVPTFTSFPDANEAVGKRA